MSTYLRLLTINTLTAMKHFLFFVLMAITICCTNASTNIPVKDSSAVAQAEQQKKVPPFVQALLDAYPETLSGFDGDSIIFADGTKMLYDDGQKRSWQQMLEHCDIEDMAFWDYTDTVLPFRDPGRIRCEAFFRKMYGNTAAEVRKHARTIKWCHKLAGQTLLVTTVNHVDQQLQKVSDELDRHPEWKAYLKSAGTFNWRIVAGTQRLSPHSFAFAIDIGVGKSSYWRWDNKGATESDNIKYRNAMLLQIVQIFEKHGFIWGGRWYHYDTMHFEYRPELIRLRELKVES